MSLYAKKVLGMANARPALRNITNKLDTSSLGLVETPRHYDNNEKIIVMIIMMIIIIIK